MSDDTKRAGDPKGTARYTVAHSLVDSYFRGQTITVEHLKAGQDREIDIDRLLRVGAIVPGDSAEAAALLDELGPDARTPEDAPVRAAVPLPSPDVSAKAQKDAAQS